MKAATRRAYLAGGAFAAVAVAVWVGVASGGGSSYTPPAPTLGSLGAQPLDATLTAFAGGTCDTDRLLYCSGADAVTSGTLTAAGRAILDDANAAAQRTTLGLGTAAVEASGAFQPSDATLTSLAALSWTAGTQVPRFTAADTTSFLTVGTAASNLVQLNGAAQLPAVDGSLLTNLPGGGIDFYDALGDGAEVLDVADFVDATTSLGATTSTCLAAVEGGRMLRMRTWLESDCATPNAGDRVNGRLAPVAAGNWIYMLRIRFIRTTDAGVPLLSYTNDTAGLSVGVVFVDGVDTEATWYSTAWNYVFTVDSTVAALANRNSVGGAGSWASAGTTTAYTFLAAGDGVWDVYVERVGTVLNWYLGRGQNDMRYVATETVTAGAGRLGLRTRNSGTSTSITAHILGWRTGFTSPY